MPAFPCALNLAFKPYLAVGRLTVFGWVGIIAPLFKLFSRVRQVFVANSAQSRKRARQAEKARQHNAGLRSRFRTVIKNVIKAVDANDKAAAAECYKKAVPVIDSMVTKKLIPLNKASRHKSRLNQHIRAMG